MGDIAVFAGDIAGIVTAVAALSRLAARTYLSEVGIYPDLGAVNAHRRDADEVAALAGIVAAVATNVQ